MRNDVPPGVGRFGTIHDSYPDQPTVNRDPVLSGERKSYRLRFSRSGRHHLCMSSVVRVRDSKGIGLCNITFSEDLVEVAGKYMPRGAGPDDPVFLRAEEKLDGTWHIICQYIRAKEEVLLWIAEAQPTWVREVRRFDSPP